MQLGHPETNDPRWVRLTVKEGHFLPGWQSYSPTVLFRRIEEVEPVAETLFEPTTVTPLPGVTVLRRFLSLHEQLELLSQSRQIIQAAPFFVPEMADGTSFRQQLSNCGELGWVAGKSRFHQSSNYRYEKTHPVTGKNWPQLPPAWQELSDRALAAVGEAPCPMQSCLLNWYSFPHSRLGMHVDKSETDLISPIVTISLGHSCIFKVATSRDGAGHSIKLNSGDITIMYGPGRLIWHGVIRLVETPIPFTAQPGRLSLTLRKVY